MDDRLEHRIKPGRYRLVPAVVYPPATGNRRGKVAPGLLVQEGCCWRMIYANPVGQCGHCMEPVAYVGRGSP